MRGPRSRAGLMAYPVGPPSEAPMPTTSSATASGPRPLGVFANDSTTNTSTNVPRISVTRFQSVLRTSGPVENTASFLPSSSSASNCLRYAAKAAQAPRKAPRNSPAKYTSVEPNVTGTPFAYSSAPDDRTPSVTAGFRCAPDLNATYTPAMTAKPQPKLMSRKPPSLPLDLASSTFATTPAPSSMSMPVPSVSLTNTSPRETFPPFAVEQLVFPVQHRNADAARLRRRHGGAQRRGVGIVERS